MSIAQQLNGEGRISALAMQAASSFGLTASTQRKLGDRGERLPSSSPRFIKQLQENLKFLYAHTPYKPTVSTSDGKYYIHLER